LKCEKLWWDENNKPKENSCLKELILPMRYDMIWYDNMNYVLVIEDSVHVFILIEIEVVMKMELVEMIL